MIVYKWVSRIVSEQRWSHRGRWIRGWGDKNKRETRKTWHLKTYGDMGASHRTQASVLGQWWGRSPGWGPRWSLATERAPLGRTYPLSQIIFPLSIPTLAWNLSKHWFSPTWVYFPASKWCESMALPSCMVRACWERALQMVSEMPSGHRLGGSTPPPTQAALTPGSLDSYPLSAFSKKQTLGCLTSLWDKNHFQVPQRRKWNCFQLWLRS